MAWSAPVVVEKGMIYWVHRPISRAFSGGLHKNFFGRAFEIFEKGRTQPVRSGTGANHKRFCCFRQLNGKTANTSRSGMYEHNIPPLEHEGDGKARNKQLRPRRAMLRRQRSKIPSGIRALPVAASVKRFQSRPEIGRGPTSHKLFE